MLAIAALALALHLSVVPNHASQLESVAIGITVTNRGRAPATLEFPTPDLYFVQILDARGSVVFDSRNGHKPIDVRRKLHLPIGTTGIAIFDWNGLNDDRRAPDAPAQYVVHVEMQSTTQHLVADMPLALLPPTPVSTLLASAPKRLVTIAGTVHREGGTTSIEDASGGSVAVSNPLGLHPQGTFVVRGTMGEIAHHAALLVSRFAPSAANLEPEATPTPLPSPSPTPTVPPRSR